MRDPANSLTASVRDPDPKDMLAGWRKRHIRAWIGWDEDIPAGAGGLANIFGPRVFTLAVHQQTQGTEVLRPTCARSSLLDLLPEALPALSLRESRKPKKPGILDP